MWLGNSDLVLDCFTGRNRARRGVFSFPPRLVSYTTQLHHCTRLKQFGLSKRDDKYNSNHIKYYVLYTSFRLICLRGRGEFVKIILRTSLTVLIIQ